MMSTTVFSIAGMAVSVLAVGYLIYDMRRQMRQIQANYSRAAADAENWKSIAEDYQSTAKHYYARMQALQKDVGELERALHHAQDALGQTKHALSEITAERDNLHIKSGMKNGKIMKLKAELKELRAGATQERKELANVLNYDGTGEGQEDLNE